MSFQGHSVHAEARAEGADTVDGAKAVVHAIEEGEIDEGRWNNEDLLVILDDADAIAFGTPTHGQCFGSV
jgi:hypothetical protein